MGRLCAETFDKLIIRRGDYLRGRTQEEVYTLLQKGIAESDKKLDFEIVHESKEAIFRALDTAEKGELVVILADTVNKDINYVSQYREQIA
jgi:cyanophycin synthetase